MRVEELIATVQQEVSQPRELLTEALQMALREAIRAESRQIRSEHVL